jgi:hypothetical protein
VNASALGTLLFAYLIETLQYFKWVEGLGIESSNLARTVMGTSFEWMDIVAYTAGIIFVILIEAVISFRKLKKATSNY